MELKLSLPPAVASIIAAPPRIDRGAAPGRVAGPAANVRPARRGHDDKGDHFSPLERVRLDAVIATPPIFSAPAFGTSEDGPVRPYRRLPCGCALRCLSRSR